MIESLSRCNCSAVVASRLDAAYASQLPSLSAKEEERRGERGKAALDTPHFTPFRTKGAVQAKSLNSYVTTQFVLSEVRSSVESVSASQREGE